MRQKLSDRMRETWILIKADIRNAKNIDSYVAVASAFLISLLGVIKSNTALLYTAIVIILGQGVHSLIGMKRQNEQIEELLSSKKITQSVASQFLLKSEPDATEVRQQMSKCRTVFLWGTTLATDIPYLLDDIKQGVRNGLEMRFLLVKPKSNAIKMAAFRAKSATSEQLSTTVEQNLTLLSGVAKEASKEGVKHTGKLLWKVIDYLPPYTMYIYDYDQPQGCLTVYISEFDMENVHRDRTTFKLTRKDDKEWFEYFVKQFEIAWEKKAKDYQPSER